MRSTITLYLSTFVVMLALDMLWLGLVARDFYSGQMGDLLAINELPAFAFYIMYVFGILLFAHPKHLASSWKVALRYGAAFGFFAYATYDLTNLATLRGWTLQLTIVDICWGTFVTAVSAAGGLRLAQFLGYKRA